MVRRSPLYLSLFALSLFTRASLGAEENGVGTTIADFSLQDYRGKRVSLHDFKDQKGVVVAFLGCDCPLAKLYAPKLQALAKDFAHRGVAVVGINSNVQDSTTKLGAFARVHGVEFPLLKDPGNVVADQFHAKRTPEFYLLDEKGVIRYRGRMDDQYDIGIQKAAPTRGDLVQAIEEVLAGDAVSVPFAEPVGCLIGRVRKLNPSGDVTYSKHIAKIFNERCVECHRPGEIAPFSLTNYQEVVGWGETIVEVTQERRMPPWLADPAYGHFRNNARLGDEELQLIREWVANGQPEGDPKDLPEPRQFVEGWTIGTPDKIVYMSDKPYKVPAEGTVEYQHITVDPGFTEDIWVRAAEARPGNRAVVHHIIVFVNPPNATGLPFMGELIGGYAPGMPPVTGHDGLAALIPAGSRLTFQMHYTPNGTAQEDLSYIGFKFADPKTVHTRAKASMAASFNINIPPYAANHKVTSRYKFRHDGEIVSLMPHMHLRGKSFKYEALFPDGTREVLLDVPRYDFNWQLRYEYETPKKMPKGTEIQCTAYFDNSTENLANPDPSKTVRWGDQTWEEMMIGWFTMTIPKDSATKK